MAISIILLEDLTSLLLEDNTDLLTDDSLYTSSTVVPLILLENGTNLLLENGSSIIDGGLNWSSSGQTTWIQPGVPDSGDQVTIEPGSIVIVDVGTTTGDGSDHALLIQPGATLVVATGITLGIIGTIDNRGSIELGPGASIDVPFGSKPTIILLETGVVLQLENLTGNILLEGSDWSLSGQITWIQAGVPGEGDTASISADSNVIVDVNTTIGDGSDQALVIQVGGILHISDGVTLTVIGAIDNHGWIEMGDGASIVYITPSTTSTDPPFFISQPLPVPANLQIESSKLIQQTAAVAQTDKFFISQPEQSYYSLRAQPVATPQTDGPTIQQTYIFPVSQPVRVLSSAPVDAPKYFDGPTRQQTYIFPVSQPIPVTLIYPVAAPKYFEGPTIQQTYIFPLLQRPPLDPPRLQTETSKLIQVATTVVQSNNFTISQPELSYYVQRLQVLLVPQLSGATTQQTYIFPLPQPVRVAPQYPVDAPKYFEGSTRQQTYIFPVSQPVTVAVPYPLNAPKYFDGPTRQQTFIFPLSQPVTVPIPQPVNARPYFEGATQQQTYIFPLSQPTFITPPQQPPVRVQLDGATRQQTFVFPLGQPQAGPPQAVQIRTYLDISAVAAPQTYVFPLSQPVPVPPTKIIQAPVYFEGATNQQTYIFPVTQPPPGQRAPQQPPIIFFEGATNTPIIIKNIITVGPHVGGFMFQT